MRLIIFLVLFFAILAVLDYYNPRDSTDTADKRSGMRIYTDAATGVQYVGAGLFGGLTVRVDATGKPWRD